MNATDTYGWANRLPVGPGSRGGHWHEPGYRAAYHRAWRAAHPDYRERERLRSARRRNPEVMDPPHYPRPLPVSTRPCACPCGCSVEIVVCGFCAAGLHEETA